MTPREENADLLAEITALRTRVTSLTRENTELQEHQTATSEVLKIISRSALDLTVILKTVAKSATRLCDAQHGHIFQFDGEVLRFAAGYGTSPELKKYFDAHPVPLGPGSASGLAASERRATQIDDIRAVPNYQFGKAASLEGWRTVLAVPMLKDSTLLGTITIWRTKVQPFTDRQIALVETFADQAVIAIENVRLFKELEIRNRDLTEALEQQTATGEILRVISRSPTDIQPVLDAVAESAARLTTTLDVAVFLRDGDGLRLAAHHGPIPVRSTVPLIREEVTGRAVLDGRTVHVADLRSETVDFPGGSENARRLGLRTVLSVPLVREGGIALGTINLRRAEVLLFTERQVALLQTFADQAVIAIENVRLFTELQEKNRALTAALEQQTATSELLKVIGRSAFDLQPVFDALAQNAVKLCEARRAFIFRYDGSVLRVVASHNASAELRAFVEEHPIQLGRGSTTARAALERRTTHIHDIQTEPGYTYMAREVDPVRTMLAIPMLRADELLGVITIYRHDVQPFTGSQIALLETFADQAAIAIENVRLFTELQASNRELTTALDTHTATGDILRVISRSQTDVQPVFDAILGSAVRLLGAYSGVVTRIAGDQIELAALTSTDDAGNAATRAIFPQSRQSEWSHAHAMRNRAPLNIADYQTDPRVPEAGHAYARARGFRSWVMVPLLRHDETIGAIAVSRREPGGFNDDEITLLKTFADQGVIAIENARLLSELQARTAELTRSVDELTALGDVGRVLSSTLDLETVLQTIVTRANQLTGTAGCTIWEYDEAREEFRLRVSHYADMADAAVLQALGRVTTMRKGQGVTTQVVERRQPVQIRDIAAEGAYESPIRQPLIEAGHRALLGVPLLSEDEVIGVLAVTRKTPGDFEPEIVRLLSTFATQSALAIQNARLFREIKDKSRQLEAASQHKSEFLANMSHELRTPLNAIIGFSEVLTDRMFGELNEKQEEYLKDIYDSGTHLLSLINDILDLSKIEAGRMELELSDFDLPTALDNALMLVRERAQRRNLTLDKVVDAGVGQIQGDERKIRQVVLNLLSNAIKFTPEGGNIELAAEPKDGCVEVSVSDTGVGIAPEDQEKVFEEFRQVGTADKKAEGTGLGLTLCRKFIELHGGTIWVKSQLGVGSTFTFTIPVRQGE